MIIESTFNMAIEFKTDHPGRDAQAVGTAKFLGEDPAKIHGEVWAVIGNKGDSQCYLGVEFKVAAIQAAMSRRIKEQELNVRLIPPVYTIGVSDGQLNGTPEMRFSLIGREIANDSVTEHLRGSKVEACIVVGACDKPQPGSVAAIVELNVHGINMSDGSIRPYIDPSTGERLDIVDGFQFANADQSTRDRIALNACPGYGSCGGMFTYNTVSSFIAGLGLEPLHMVSPASSDPRRINEFPEQIVDYLQVLIKENIRAKDIVTPKSLRNATLLALALGGSTNVLLHAPEIARAAGIDFWKEVISQEGFNRYSRRIPVLTNARPYGKYSMVDIDEKGGLQVVVKELLDSGYMDGEAITCTGETLAEQVERLSPPDPDGEIIYSITNPYKESGGLRVLSGNLAPNGGAVIKIAGVEQGLVNGVFEGKARTFDSEAALLDVLTNTPDIFEDKDMVVIRYEGPKGAPGMPEMLDPTSRITTLCKEKGITIALMTDARFSGGSVGVVIGHVTPEAYDGGPIALVKEGDTIRIDLYANTINDEELRDRWEMGVRQEDWEELRIRNGGVHPSVKPVENRLLKRMRRDAKSALEGAGWAV